MGQITGGLYSFLSSASFYEFFQDIVGGRRAREQFVSDYVKPYRGLRLLDLGCGTSSILESLPDFVEYVGCDLSEEYLLAARHRFGSRGTWLQQGVEEIASTDMGTFGLVMADGLLHHLDDPSVYSILPKINDLLAPGGRFVSKDPCRLQGQNLIAKGLVLLDRGRNARTVDEYRRLLDGFFVESTAEVREDLLRVPYTHVIMTAVKR